MNRKLIWLTLIGLLYSVHLINAQEFWKITNTFPGGPKTGITIAGDSCIFAGLRDGVIKSCNEGQGFDQSLDAQVVYTLFTTASDAVLAGGAGKVYISNDLGATWDSVSLGTIYPVTQIIENSSGEFFAITGVFDVEEGYLGDGMFYSEDGGMSWEKRNTGLGNYTSCERITVDRNGRLYLGVADEFVTGNAGLFISDNNGLMWHHVDITIDGRGAINDQIKIGNTVGLSVSPDDSLNFSFTGIAFNAGVTLNTRKHIDDVTNGEYWQVYKVFNSVSWWLDRALQNIYFAQNGDWYSSFPGSENSGGTYYSTDQGRHWEFINYSLGLNIFAERSIQYFAELPSGRVYMVQLLDERIYFTDASLVSSISDPGPVSDPLPIFPNPAGAGGPIRIPLESPYTDATLSMMDSAGRSLKTNTVIQENIITLQAPDVPGIYTIIVEGPLYRRSGRLIVVE